MVMPAFRAARFGQPAQVVAARAAEVGGALGAAGPRADECGPEEHARRSKGSAIADDQLERAAAIFRAAGDLSRLKLLYRLCDGEWCVTELAEAAGVGLSTVSQQLRLLRAERIVARPGDKQYGRLAVMAGWRTEAKIMFDVAPSAFVPPPKVTSSVVRLTPRQSLLPCDLAALERITAAAFGQRRKMLRQSLRALASDPLPILEAAGIDPTARAEEISVEGFVALASGFSRFRDHGSS